MNIKDFELKDSGNVVKKRSNKKLTEEKITKIKETGQINADEYLEVTQPKKKKDYVKEVEPQLVKAKEENQLGVPSSFFDLTIKEQSMLMFYLSSDFVHPVLQKRTHMNILYSYVSAYLDDDELKKVWDISIVPDDKEGIVTGIKVKNYKKYAEVQAKALETFNRNPLIVEVWNDLVRMSFGADPEALIRNAIIKDALYSENSTDKNANRRMAIDILAMNKENGGNTLNVFLDGGGKELAEALSKDDFIVVENDLEVD